MRTMQALPYALFTIMAAFTGSGGCGPPLLDGGGPATGFFARRASTSKRPGMGAVVYYDSGGGTMFRVWAPNASAVSVAGDWNGWSSTADPLTSEGNGNWSVDIGYAHPGHNYKYYITHAGGSFYR